MAKLLRVLLIVILFISLALASVAAFLLQREMKKSYNFDDRLTQALKRQEVIQSSLETSNKDTERLNNLYSQSQKKIGELNSKISILENEKINLSNKLSNFREQFQSTSSQKEAFIIRIKELSSDLEQKDKELKIANKAKQRLFKKIEGLEKRQGGSIKLEKIVIGAAREDEALEGEIVSVDRKFKFLIIDHGQRQGVKIGDIFSCFYKDREIGRVKIEKVYESVSAANFLPNLQARFLKQGQRVLRILN